MRLRRRPEGGPGRLDGGLLPFAWSWPVWATRVRQFRSIRSWMSQIRPGPSQRRRSSLPAAPVSLRALRSGRGLSALTCAHSLSDQPLKRTTSSSRAPPPASGVHETLATPRSSPHRLPATVPDSKAARIGNGWPTDPMPSRPRGRSLVPATPRPTCAGTRGSPSVGPRVGSITPEAGGQLVGLDWAG